MIVLGPPDSLLVLNAATIEERKQQILGFQFEQMAKDAEDVLIVSNCTDLFMPTYLINHPPFLLYGVFGFAQTIFTQHERGQDYQIEAGFLSGRPETGLVSDITLETGDAGIPIILMCP